MTASPGTVWNNVFAEAFSSPVTRVASSAAVARSLEPAMYAVTLVMEDGSKSNIECAGDTYVLDQAEEVPHSAANLLSSPADLPSPRQPRLLRL